MTDRHSFARIAEVAPIPNLIKVQRDSFDWFLKEGLKELFAEISPMQDFTGRSTDLTCGADRRRRSEGMMLAGELALAEHPGRLGRQARGADPSRT